MIRRLIVGHAESAKMPCLRRLAWALGWLAAGLCLGAVTDLIVRAYT